MLGAWFTCNVSPSSLITAMFAAVNGDKPAGTKWQENPSRVKQTCKSVWSLLWGIN
jgi:hypothetical protein